VTFVRKVILSLIVTVSTAAALGLPAFAANYGGGSVQGYAADTPIDNGTIVQLNAKDSTKVQPATMANLANMFGVTVDRTQLLAVSSNDALANEVFVAVSGTYNVLVSTENDSIAVGDYITLSSINGVGMKASTDQKIVFGRASGSFDGKGITLGTTPIKDTTGKTIKTVSLGSIPVAINIQHNPNIKSTKVDVPDWLQRLGEQIAEKTVSPIRIYLSLGITGACVITALILLYAGVRNAIVAVGRNPLSKKSIFRALLQVILTSILILIIGLFAVYLLLKL
jgi:hypothetical protein